jgi:hypothetical protein
MKQKLSKIVLEKKEKLYGFKILGVFPFYLKYITLATQIELCAIQDKIIQLKKGEKASIDDFYNHDLMLQSKDLIFEFCTVGLINDRFLGSILRPLIELKIKKCGHRHIHSIYAKLFELRDPSFFLDYWTHLQRSDSTILKEEKQS